MNMFYHANTNKMKVGMAIFILDKVDLWSKKSITKG